MIVKIKDKEFSFDSYVQPLQSIQQLAEKAYQQGRADAIDEVLNKINEEVDMWWNLEKENSENDANWYASIKMLLEELKEQAE